jgi:hypothetical protein
MYLRRSISGALIVMLLAAYGCSGDNVASVVAAKNSTNIKRVRNMYEAYMLTHGKGPMDEASLKDFITKKMSPVTLKLMTIDPTQVDAMFISERDGKPFQIKPGLHWGGPGSPNPAVVSESQGVGGLRQVAFGFGNVEDVDDGKYKEVWGEKGP